MIWIIINIFFLIFVAILMFLNGDNSVSFNFFGIAKDNVPTVVILMLGFICGILYSFIMYVVHYFKKMNLNIFKKKKKKIKDLEGSVKEKEKEIKEREKSLKADEKNNNKLLDL